jgi:hypothetical protein
MHKKLSRMQQNAANQITSNQVMDGTAMGAVSASAALTPGLASQLAEAPGMATSTVPGVFSKVSGPGSSTTPVYTNDHEVWDYFEMGNHRWTIVDINNATRIFDALKQACHSPEELKKNNYTLEPPTAEFLDGFQICKNCAGESELVSKSSSY